jgi:hypothetical protein
VITHEYGHGISNRLTGGPSNVNCLSNAEQMGEGWSDWFAVTLTTRPSDTATTPRGIGPYVSFQPADGDGIRPTPYTTDMTVNPSTYASVANVAQISQPQHRLRAEHDAVEALEPRRSARLQREHL